MRLRKAEQQHRAGQAPRIKATISGGKYGPHPYRLEPTTPTDEDRQTANERAAHLALIEGSSYAGAPDKAQQAANLEDARRFMESLEPWQKLKPRGVTRYPFPGLSLEDAPDLTAF